MKPVLYIFKGVKFVEEFLSTDNKMSLNRFLKYKNE